jgi:(S)-2-hydroxyglutarate dehydrogenase
MSASEYDLLIVGGGIVGLATAWRASQQFPNWRILLLEKEATLAAHQTGRNSGVIHSGIYYKPGSLRALNCRAGKTQLEQFCNEFGIAWQQTGKVIVATETDELPRLQTLYERGQANGVDCELISAARLRELEPHCAGLQAIYVRESGIVDYVGVCQQLAALSQAVNTTVQLNSHVTQIRPNADSVLVITTTDEYRTKQLVTCGGLHADRLATMAGVPSESQIVPFRGEYFQLRREAENLCRTLIYPVPDPQFPFLGVHYTRMIAGGVECGPNAVLALAREGYTWQDINFRDLWQTLGYVGFRRLAWKYWRMGLAEVWRSLNQSAFLASLQRLIPEITAADIRPIPAGVRAQAVTPAGELADDFLIQRSAHGVHVINAPSPAATAALNIGKQIVEQL